MIIQIFHSPIPEKTKIQGPPLAVTMIIRLTLKTAQTQVQFLATMMLKERIMEMAKGKYLLSTWLPRHLMQTKKTSSSQRFYQFQRPQNTQPRDHCCYLQNQKDSITKFQSSNSQEHITPHIYRQIKYVEMSMINPQPAGHNSTNQFD